MIQKDFILSMKKVEEPVKLSLDLGPSNSTRTSQNTHWIENKKFKINELKENFSKLNEDYKTLEEELDDNSDRSLRKTLISKNIPVQQQRESWAETKIILTKEIHTLIPNPELELYTVKNWKSSSNKRQQTHQSTTHHCKI